MDVLDAGVDEEDLPSPLEFPLDGVPDDFFIIADHKGPNREAIFGRGLDEAEIPNSGDSHLEGPRNGGRRQRDHIHQFSHLLQFFLMGDAESMLLINDDQPQIPEGHVLLREVGVSRSRYLPFPPPAVEGSPSAPGDS